jgi:hypothetical protein
LVQKAIHVRPSGKTSLWASSVATFATKVFTWVCGVHWALAENANKKAFRKKRYRLLRTGFFKESKFVIQIYPNKRFEA